LHISAHVYIIWSTFHSSQTPSSASVPPAHRVGGGSCTYQLFIHLSGQMRRKAWSSLYAISRTDPEHCGSSTLWFSLTREHHRGQSIGLRDLLRYHDKVGSIRALGCGNALRRTPRPPLVPGSTVVSQASKVRSCPPLVFRTVGHPGSTCLVVTCLVQK
jgi:hypothetical protein